MISSIRFGHTTPMTAPQQQPVAAPVPQSLPQASQPMFGLSRTATLTGLAAALLLPLTACATATDTPSTNSASAVNSNASPEELLTMIEEDISTGDITDVSSDDDAGASDWASYSKSGELKAGNRTYEISWDGYISTTEGSGSNENGYSTEETQISFTANGVSYKLRNEFNGDTSFLTFSRGDTELTLSKPQQEHAAALLENVRDAIQE